VIAATGSVATVKLPLLVDEVAKQRAGVKVVMTKASRHFVSKEKLVEMCSIRENEVGTTNPGVARANRLCSFLSPTFP